MLGKDAILQFFDEKEIRDIFHIPGVHSLPLNERFVRRKVHVINGRHEVNLVYMADGYARTADRAGVLIVTPGPGLGNVVSGAMEAFSDDVPLVIIHIDTGREDIGKGILHEVVEPEAIFTHFTKGTFAVSRKEELVPVLDRAYRTAISGRRGPVVVSIPYTFFEKDVPFKVEEYKEKEERLDLTGIAEVVRHARKPLIIGGKYLMHEAVKPFVEELCGGSGIPFLTTTGGKGVVSEANEWAFGNIMRKGVVKEIISSADVVVALGTRLRDVDARRRGVKISTLIHIDIDGAWVGKNYPVHLSASGDMRAAVEDLARSLKGATFEWDLRGLKKRDEEEQRAFGKSFAGFQAVRVIREAIPDETTTVWDLSLLGYWAEYYLPVLRQRTFIMPRGISPIFYALPAAIGAKLGRMERPCLSVAGDGSFLPCVGELATVRHYSLPLVMLVYNNTSYGILEGYMDSSYGIQGSMALTDPDFVKLARSFDIKAKRVRTIAGLRAVLRKDVTWEEPFLIEFNYPSFPPPWSV